MKTYNKLDMYVLTFTKQDVITTSGGFLGGEEDENGFGNPNDPDPVNFGD